MDTSYRRLLAFANAANQYLSFPLEIYKIERDLCSVDTQGNILRDSQGKLMFTRANQQLRDNRVEELLKRKTKFTWALERVKSQLGDKVDGKYNRAQEALRIHHAGEDAEGFVKPPDARGNYASKKAELAKLGDALAELLDKENISLTPYMAQSIPKDLTEEQLETFEGFVISKEDVARILAEREAKLEDDNAAEVAVAIVPPTSSDVIEADPGQVAQVAAEPTS